MRSIEVDARRRQRQSASEEREAMRRQRVLAKREDELAKYAENVRAAHEAEQFANYLELLVSVHKDCGPTWDWPAIAREQPPAHPIRMPHSENAARAALAAYKPGFFERFFGGDKPRITALKQAIVEAHRADDAAYMVAVERHQQDYAACTARTAQAQHILARNTRAYPTVLQLSGALDELTAFKVEVSLTATEQDAIAFTCSIMDDQMVPREEVKLTAKGKLTTKEIAAGRYWALYQDHVCSAAIRVAREVFAVLPVSRVVVNIGPMRLNTSTGHLESVTFLAVHIARGELYRINLASIDPSDSMKNFHHRMKFKKTTGFEPVEPITLDEQWITT
ncbi:MAG TPA: hypothetical protein VGB85_31230 [Nannocystis sp.]|jgi:hypothetical protein